MLDEQVDFHTLSPFLPPHFFLRASPLLFLFYDAVQAQEQSKALEEEQFQLKMLQQQLENIQKEQQDELQRTGTTENKEQQQAKVSSLFSSPSSLFLYLSPDAVP